MAQDGNISTPTAILLGSVVIALGLFFGLRGRSDPQITQPQTTLPSAGQTSPPSPRQTPEVRPAEPAEPLPTVDLSVVRTQAEAALAKLKKDLTDQCLKPSLAKQPEPKTIKFTFDYTFDKDGKQVGRGVSEDRATSRPDVTSCITEKLPTLSVAPPGQTTRVDVPFTLP